MTGDETSASEPKWVLREANLNDVGSVFNLMKLVFGEDLTPETVSLEYWLWQSISCPGCPAGHFVAEDKGRIVAHYGCLPALLKTQHEEVKAVVAVDALVHPDYRKQGLFTAIGAFSLARMKERGFPLAIGFTAATRAKYVLPGHFKIGWFRVMGIPVLGRPLNLRAVANSKFRNRVIGKLAPVGLKLVLSTVRRWKRTVSECGVTCREITAFDPRFDSLWESTRNDYPTIRRRDGEFIKWRFFDSPCREYHVIIAESGTEIAGYLVYRQFSRFGLNSVLVIDLYCGKHITVISGLLLDSLLGIAENLKADIIAAMASSADLRRVLRHKGFLNTGEEYNFIVRINDTAIKHIDFNNPSDWFLTLADFDVL